MIIWQRVSGTSEYTSQAGRPFAEQVLRVQAGKLVDVTPEFCGQIFQAGRGDYDTWTRELTPENIKRLQSVKKARPDAGVDAEDVMSALLSRAHQRVLCRQYDEALADLNLWPKGSRDETKDNFADSIKDVSPEFAKRLAGAPEAK
jgi:hypothetical protein